VAVDPSRAWPEGHGDLVGGGRLSTDARYAGPRPFDGRLRQAAVPVAATPPLDDGEAPIARGFHEVSWEP